LSEEEKNENNISKFRPKTTSSSRRPSTYNHTMSTNEPDQAPASGMPQEDDSQDERNKDTPDNTTDDNIENMEMSDDLVLNFDVANNPVWDNKIKGPNLELLARV
jgi:hypothetical protein